MTRKSLSTKIQSTEIVLPNVDLNQTDYGEESGGDSVSIIIIIVASIVAVVVLAVILTFIIVRKRYLGNQDRESPTTDTGESREGRSMEPTQPPCMLNCMLAMIHFVSLQ